MRLINLHIVLIALVATSATASFIPAGERGTSFLGKIFGSYFSLIYLLSRPAVAVESGEDEGFFPGTPVPKR